MPGQRCTPHDIQGARHLYGERASPALSSIDLGDLTNAAVTGELTGNVTRTHAESDSYRFTLSAERQMHFELLGLGADADLRLLDSSGLTIAASLNVDTRDDTITETLDAGTYILRVDAFAGGSIGYRLRYGGVTSRESDLEVSRFDVEGDGSFAPGERGTVDITFRNLGTARASAFDYHLYLSTDPTITSADTRLALHGFGSGRVSFGLGAGDTDEERNVGFTVPVGPRCGQLLPGGDRGRGRRGVGVGREQQHPQCANCGDRCIPARAGERPG